MSHVLVSGCEGRIDDECGRHDSESDGHGQISGAKGPLQVWLADAQDHQGYKFQNQARAIEDEVDGDEALEAELQSQRPGGAADQQPSR